MAEATIDIEALSAPLAEDAPSGPDLEYDPEYMELVQAAQGTPEREVGETFVPAEPPDWKDLKRQSLSLLGRSRDLRLCVHLLQGQIESEGWPGVRDTLKLVLKLLQDRWADVHPQLDPDDGDPTFRVNAVAELAPAPGAVPPHLHLVQRLRSAALTDSPQLGRFSLRDYAIANGDQPAPTAREGEEPPQVAEMGTINAASQDTPIERLTEISEAIDECKETMAAIDEVLKEKAGVGNAPDLSAVDGVIKEASQAVKEWLMSRGAAVEMDGEEGDGAAGGGQAAPAQTGEIRSRDDVIRTLDRVLRYYETSEPSSPVPLLLRRAKRLVHKSFAEIMQDMAPDAVGTIGVISGETESE